MRLALATAAAATLLYLALAAPEELPSPLNESPVGARCGAKFNAACADGYCCSKAGYCGKGQYFCGVPVYCQESYGWCDSYKSPPGFNLHEGHRKYNSKFPLVIEECSAPKKLALSFDDGPGNATVEVLDVLKEFKAHATFFLGGMLNGRGALDSPE